MSRDYLIRLGWPVKALSPNGRLDRRSATASRQAARLEGWTEAQRVKAMIADDAHLIVEFMPPDRIRRDLDNLLASVKSHLDGIAKAAGVDDAGWSYTIRKGSVVKGGAVLVHVTTPAADTWQSIGDVAKRVARQK